MRTTEVEAQTKRCAYPKLKLVGDVRLALLRCEGSACMAWRWLPAHFKGDIPEGYCGRVGKPDVE